MCHVAIILNAGSYLKNAESMNESKKPYIGFYRKDLQNKMYAFGMLLVSMHW